MMEVSPFSVGLPTAAMKRLLVYLLLAICLVAVSVPAIALIRGGNSLSEIGPRKTYTITRGELVVTETVQGTLESSKNTEIKCNIRGGYGGRGGASTVTWVIPSGTVVQAGEDLVRLDTKILEETVSLGKTDVHIATAALAGAEVDLATAEVAIDGYLEGRYRSQMKSLERQLVTGKANLQSAEKMLAHSQLLFKRGYVTNLELKGNTFTVTQAELELRVTEAQMDILRRIVRAMQLETLNGQLNATQERLEGRKAGLALEERRRDLAMEELENCVIRAERGGLVIYPSTAKWKDTPDITEGASVRKDQVLLLMPDMEQLQVRVEIHESIIHRITPGLAARVTLSDRTLDTTVFSVASVASPAGWRTGNEVKYGMIIKLPSVQGPKPGMSAEVEVIVAKHKDVLSVPVEAVVETDQGYCCWVGAVEKTERRSLQLSDSNDEFIVVESGLQEGDQVVLDPTAFIEEARTLVGTPLVHTIMRGDMNVTLTEQGTLESSDNTEIKCDVRGNSTINWVIENGTQVKRGDELVRLENKQVEDFVHERTKYAHLSRDAAIGFRAQATREGLAISEYEEGRFPIQLLILEKNLVIAESNLFTAKDMLDHSVRMLERGYRSQLDVEQKTSVIRNAELNVEVLLTEIEILKKFTKMQELVTLRGNWESAKAAAAGHEEVLVMDEARIALARKEIDRCVIRAERSGLVIYPGVENWKRAPDIAEGATVHNDQVLLLMPDTSKMQVKVGIHDSMIDHVRLGMSARVTLPDRTLNGEVSSVASVAPPAVWWTGNIVKYDVIIQLPSVEGLKPGMNAEVEVTMDQHKNVLLIPVAAVMKTEQGYCCWVGTVEKAQRRSLQLSHSNDEFIVVESGLQEGDQVLLNPTAFIEDAQNQLRQSPLD